MLCAVRRVCIDDISLLSYRWNDKKAQMHYVLFCMPEISPCKLYLLRKGTDPNRYTSVIVGVCVCEVLCVFNLLLYNVLCFWHRHIPNSVMSIDLSHHLDNAEDDNAAAQLVPLVSFLPIKLVKQTEMQSNSSLSDGVATMTQHGFVFQVSLFI